MNLASFLKNKYVQLIYFFKNFIYFFIFVSPLKLTLLENCDYCLCCVEASDLTSGITDSVTQENI